MKRMFNKKTFALFGFLLFTGLIIVNITPNTVQASRENITSIASTSKVYNNAAEIISTDMLTQQQTQELQRIFDDLKHRLSSEASTDETQRIFNETIIELDRYHLLPDGMSVQQAQRLVSHATIRDQRFYQRFLGQPEEGTIQNMFCSIAGNASTTHVAKPVMKLTMRLFDIMDYCTGNSLLVSLSSSVWFVLDRISTLGQIILLLPGRHCGVSIYFGNYHFYPYPTWRHPAEGWVSTEGLLGKQNITGSFWGQKMTGGWQPQDDWYMNFTWRGCVGFTGLLFYAGQDTVYFLGSALQVNIGPDRP
jgi:hypothetical protein